MTASAEVQLVGSNTNGDTVMQVDPTFQAGRFSLRPVDYAPLNGVLGGHFRAAFSYSNTAAKPAAGSQVFSLRNTDPQKIVMFKRVILWVSCTTAYTAAGAQDMSLSCARNSSSSPSGGTALSIAAGGYLRKTMAASILGNTLVGQISSGDTLTAGTQTVDTYPLGYAAWVNPAAAGAVVGPFYLLDQQAGDHPAICAMNEGIVLATPLGNAQAAGVSKFTVVVDWAEVISY